MSKKVPDGNLLSPHLSARDAKSSRQREFFAKEGNEVSERYPSLIITRNAVELIKLGSRRHTATPFASNRLTSHFFEKVVLEKLGLMAAGLKYRIMHCHHF